MRTKDQERARRAYENVQPLWTAYLEARKAGDTAAQSTAKKACDDYEIAVKALGANVLRSGLSAALADLMRRGSKASDVVAHLVSFGIPGLRSEDEGANLLQKASNLSVGQYMLATRETLQVVMWLKRACEAIFEKENAPDAGGDRRQEGDRDA